MDRFAEGDADFKDDVPQHPMTKFVKSEPSQPQSFGKIEIQASRREQKKEAQSQQAAQVSQAQDSARVPSSSQVPSWAGTPPPGHVLQVFKDSKQIDAIPLTKAMTLFGRSQGADVTLDHQSLSRQHATVCYHKMTAKWLITDMNSVHGTFCDGKPLTKNRSTELKPGSKLQLGASTRVFVLQNASKQKGHGRDTGSQLPPRLSGPQASSSPGKFASLVQQSYLEERPSSKQTLKQSAEPLRRPPGSRSLTSGLYDSLPSPTKREESN